MECTWDDALLRRVGELPAELLTIVQHGDNSEYLEALTTAALNARYTYILLAHCEDIFAHICASLRCHGSFASSIAACGRIVPYSPFLSPYAIRLLESESYSLSPANSSGDDLLYLLGLFRLLRSDHHLFRKYVRPSELTSMLGRSSHAVTYLVIRILQTHLRAADRWFELMVRRYIGEDLPDGDINDHWDEKFIDYRFLSMWEDHRQKMVRTEMAKTKQLLSSISVSRYRILSKDDLHSYTSIVGGVLFPPASFTTYSNRNSGLILTKTVSKNLRTFAGALKSSDPLLLTGVAGCGKTTLVRHVSEALGTFENLVTLHLNEQSDAKLLLGIYTTGKTSGSFVWKPGVLTTAVQEGRWVLIEDLDRAPNEVIGTLLPLIEKRELFIPSRKETINAAEGFRLIATVRSTVNFRGVEAKSLINMLGIRHWQQIETVMPGLDEQAQILQSLYPNLGPLLPQFISVYDRLCTTLAQNVSLGQTKTGSLRAISPKDLMKWSRRVCTLIGTGDKFTNHDLDNVYLEAVDCFVGALPDSTSCEVLASIIAEEMRIDPVRRDHLLSRSDISCDSNKSQISIGRYRLPKSHPIGKIGTAYSLNPHTTRMLERVAAVVSNREPLLLVGETGVGKTTAIQYLAKHLGKKLVAFNLSQQSEAGDLLGGFKPVNARSLMIPLKDEFDELFAQSFSPSKNQLFLDLLRKQLSKSNWKSVCKLWRQALGMVEQKRSGSLERAEETPNKKRKIEGKHTIDFIRWDSFAAKVDSIERRLISSGDNFAFEFIEGRIVQAIRNGDWVLLDEINLASPDTLESIADLLDPTQPSILLTEAGNIDRINAHPDFRVFAAMNPATDIGKKDLPAGIRSRFTEYYVESPDKDLKSLQSIVRAYLRQESMADPSISSDVSLLYQEITKLAGDNKLVDGAGQHPHFSLRTLTRTLTYAKHIQSMCSLRRALYEGFQMSFMTLLDAESASLIEPLMAKRLFPKRKNIHTELQRALRKPDDGRQYVQGFPGCRHWLRNGRHDLEDQPQYIITPFVSRNLENLVRAASTRQFPILIQGPTSSGKTSMIEYLAKRTGHKFVRINNHEHTDLQEYLGTYTSDTEGRLRFQDGALVEALREGHWVVLDELNLAPTDVLEALNRLLDDNRELLIPETQEVIRPHEDFVLFATQNPAGLYGGRKTLSRAFRNRFLELHFDDIPVDELQEILQRRTQLPESRCRRIVSVYKELSILRQENRLFEHKSFATLRDLFRWALRTNDTIDQLAANGYMLLCERVRKPEERMALKAVIEKVMSAKGPRVTIHEGILYSEACNEIQEYMQSAAGHDIVWTKAMRRLYVLVSKAIQNNEPVLLVGETGSGKTTVCQMLAQALQKQLYTVNAHQNTETGDLIGSQRPVRNRAAIESTLRDQLFSSTLFESVNAQQGTDELSATWERALALLDKEERAAYVRTREYLGIQATRTRFKALFEWVDGSLVQAMSSGNLFLLDEISLAEDSVLERINSVLESQRSILLAEKGSLDTAITAAPGFQFFATMNPGGDYGKRELSPALRNRFTEIWVPSLSDTEDVLQILHARLVSAAQQYAKAMVHFAVWFKARYDTSASSSISMRDILAWLEFVNAFAKFSVEASIVQGAAMVYIDTLGANPAGLMSISPRSIEAERRSCLSELGRLLDQNINEFYPDFVEIAKSNTHFSIGPFKVSRITTNEVDPEFFFDAPTTKSNAMRVLRALQISKPVMLEGSPGVGKTALVTAIANTVGIPLTRINLSDQTEILDLFGSDVPVEQAQAGTFVWRDAPFLRAMKNGEWVLLDEMNLASQSVLEGLNACIDHRGEVFVPELSQAFSKHPNFRLFAAQNPHHQGGGRKGLPVSFVNRFTLVYADTVRSEDLTMICRQRFPSTTSHDIEKAVSFVSQLSEEVTDRGMFGSNGGPWEFNLRDITRWLALTSSCDGLLRSGTARNFAKMLFIQRFRTSFDRAAVEKIFSAVFEDAPPLSDLFYGLSSQTVQMGIGLLKRDALHAAPIKFNPTSLPTSNHQRAYESVMVCIQQQWPVILSGSSGAGKTTIIERLAAVIGARITTLSLNSETDASDLIGGYEQSDSQRQILQALTAFRANLERFVKQSLTDGSTVQPIELLELFQNLEFGSKEVIPSGLRQMVANSQVSITNELRDALEAADATKEGLFEWIDGPLIEAVQQGNWLVLDNANLCSPSVLDRLNSLLEPNGVITVNEHSGPDGTPLVLRPHPDFRVFLTIDPRFGELSRAMRNRAVELHMNQDDALSPNLSAKSLQTESSVARFQAAEVLGSCGAGVCEISVLHDHFSFGDQSLVPRLHRQLQGGLFEGAFRADNETSANGVKLAALSIENMFEVAAACQHSAARRQASADLNVVQTLHPLNNSPLVKQSQHEFLQALSLGTFYDLSISLNHISRSVAASKSNRYLLERLDRLPGILPQLSAKNNVRGQIVFGTMEEILQSISSWLNGNLNHAYHDLREVKHMVIAVLSLCQVFMATIKADSLDAASFNACVFVGNAICSQALSFPLTTSTSITKEIQSSLSRLQITSNGITGCGSVELWRGLKHETLSSEDQLISLLRFESLLDRFDQATSEIELPLEEIVNLRIGFQRALNLRVTVDTEFDNLTGRVADIVDQSFQNNTSETSLIKTPHFAKTFDLLCQRVALQMLTKSSLPQDEVTALEVLAGRRTVDGTACFESISRDSAPDQFRLLGLSSFGSKINPLLPSDAGNASLGKSLLNRSILRSLADIEHINLGSLSLLENETKTLGRMMACHAHTLEKDCLPSLDASLENLTRKVLTCFSSSSEGHPFQRIALQLVSTLDDNKQDGNLDFLSEIKELQALDPSLAEIVNRFLEILQYLRRPISSNPETYQLSALAWSEFAISCLDLFVPNHPFDPALVDHIERSVYLYSKSDLSSRLIALQKFTTACTGQTDTLRSRLLQDEWTAMGADPLEAKVLRPRQSQLLELLGDFEAVMRTLQPLRRRILNRNSGSLLSAGDWENMRILRLRLLGKYRAYADLTNPVVGFIDCIAISDRLLLHAQIKANNSSSLLTLASITPLQNAQLETWLSDDTFIKTLQICQSQQDKLYWLSIVSARTFITSKSDISHGLQAAIDDTFRYFYNAWRIELNREQKLTAAKSSLYKYRAVNDDTDEATPEELDELFPTYASGSAVESKDMRRDKQQSIASQLSNLYHSIYKAGSEKSNDMIHILQNFTELESLRDAQSETTAKLPSLLCALKNLADNLASNQETQGKHNVYKDPNVTQSKKLVILVQRTQARFGFIHRTWPDHASPIEVLRSCDNILNENHLEPLMRLLPSVEKLHKAVYEWQKVASTEYSASALLEEITNVIVHWRQLELSTWSGLFDREDEQCKEHAASWWYIAYETISLAPSAMNIEEENLEEFSEGLTQTLGGFLSSCGVGEFTMRLRMLLDFQAALTVPSYHGPAFFNVRNALANLIAHYSHFEQKIAEHISNKRKGLEKEIKDVILLASWKDRNIEVLKGSSEKSHRKLFRLVRKYRLVLSEPVTPFMQGDFPATQTLDYENQSSRAHEIPAHKQKLGLKLWHSILNRWAERSSGLVDPSTAAKDLTAKSRTILQASNSKQRIDGFLKALEEESQELRKATPAVYKEESKQLIQHLKTRKRRLLADVLRDVRLMGFQSSVSEDVLHSQRNLHIVLASSSPLSLNKAYLGVDLADKEFSRMLHVMSMVRESVAKHSEDLTAAEVNRSKVLLESMLQVSLAQRKNFVQHLSQYESFERSLQQFKTFATCETPMVRGRQRRSSRRIGIEADVLISVLEAAVNCIDIQSNFAGSNYSAILEDIRKAVEELIDLKNKLSELRPLPKGINSDESMALEARYELFSSQMSFWVVSTSQAYPELEPTLSELSNWTGRPEHDAVSEETDTSSSKAGHVWVRDLFSTLDHTLDCVNELCSKASTQLNIRGDKAWLREQDKILDKSIQSLHLNLVTQSLTDLLDQLRSIQQDDSITLAQLASICYETLPILEAYATTAMRAISSCGDAHTATCRMTNRLGSMFTRLASQGFCTPPENASKDDQTSGDVESGTGLGDGDGDGDGAEDISKDVKPDEDLSDLAQESKSTETKQELQAEKDAVDMADEDLAGELDEVDGSDGEAESDGQNDGSEEDIEEETGEIDGAQSSTVDEKISEGRNENERQEKEADDQKGKRNDEVAASGTQEPDVDDSYQDDDPSQDEGDIHDTETIENQEKPQADAADPHMKEEENLELPEDMMIDGEKAVASDESDMNSDLEDDQIEQDDAILDQPSGDIDVDQGERDNDSNGKPDENLGEPEMEGISENGENSDDERMSDVGMLDTHHDGNDPPDGMAQAESGQGGEADASKVNGEVPTAPQETAVENETTGHSDPVDGEGEGSRKAQEQPSSHAEEVEEGQRKLPFKQLGDILEQWYNQHRDIESAKELPATEDPRMENGEVADARFEHIPENTESDHQALGAASTDQARALDDEKSLPVNELEERDNQTFIDDSRDDVSSHDSDAHNEAKTLRNRDSRTHEKANAMIGTPHDIDTNMDEQDVEFDDIESVDEQLTNTHISRDDPENQFNIADARMLWAEHEARTRNMALMLTEHLRLILQPTQATKMRGDFRTGKRLNIKKIIPYIASSYKRDKIWMRRSVPSKRSYQIMLAIDDSKSMAESDSKSLAFDTLCLVAKSMSMLEVGELCVVGFGESVNVAHDFSTPFTSEAGAEVFRQVSFSQSETNVRKLLETSISLFREARLRATTSTIGNLWQLQLIVSDGVCEDHPAIRQLVRQAHEERIMIVFIIVDAGAQTATIAENTAQSILDLQTAEFTKDSNGEMQLNMVKYLDTFPFRYYLIVRDALELPRVLASALRQWFAEVVDTAS